MYRFRTPLIALVVLAVVGLPGGARFVRAQEGTPAASPAASQCTIEPRPVDFLIAIVEAPNPETTPTPIAQVPANTEVDRATSDAVLTVLYTLVACVNAGDSLRAFALFDDVYLRRIIDPEGHMDADVAYELGKQFEKIDPSADDELTSIVRVVSMAMSTDGTVTVAIETRGGAGLSEDHVQIDLFVLRRTDSGWKIIDGASNLPDPAGEATPNDS